MSSQLSSPLPAEEIALDKPHWASAKVAKWRENPERLAWFVIFFCFAIFVFLFFAVPFSVQYTIRYLPVAQSGRFDPALGTFLLYPPDSNEGIGITDVREGIGEGDTIVARGDSTQGTLSLLSDEEEGRALGSLQMFSGARLNIEKLRRPFFSRWSQEPYWARLYLESGQARIFTNSGDQRPLMVELKTPHGVMQLGAGAYRVSVETNQTTHRTDVTVLTGLAQLTHETGELVVVNAGFRGWMTADQLSLEPAQLEQNLVNFISPLQKAWQSYQNAEKNVKPGTVYFIERDGRTVAYFIRQGQENGHNEVGITQTLDKRVDVYDSLVLQVDVNLLWQSLPGAGVADSEFPLRIEISYTDIYGQQSRTWGQGFFYRDPEAPKPPEIPNGTKFPQGQWRTYQSENLLSLLEQQGTRPSRIDKIRIYASGHNYESMVSEVYLIAK